METLKAGTIKRIHVDRQILARNRKLGQFEPAYTIQTSKGSLKARVVQIDGFLEFNQYSKQLSCGARMYGETKAEVRYGD